MRLRNVGRAIAATTAAVLGIAAMSGALGMTTDESFRNCMENTSGSDAARESCCAEAGGSWVEIYDQNGNVSDAFCDDAEEDWTDPGPDEPEEIRQPARTTTTSGTYQQTSTPAPSKTWTTSGTYQIQQPSPTPAPRTTTTSRTTSGTYATR